MMWGKKDNQDPWELNYDVQLENWYAPKVKVYCWPCQLKTNCFWWSLLIGVEGKKAFTRSIPAYQVVRDTLICWSYVTRSGIAIGVELSLWLVYDNSRVKFMIIHCHSSRSMCFFHRPNRWVEWGCGGENHDPWIFQVLDGGPNFWNPSRNVSLLLAYYFAR